MKLADFIFQYPAGVDPRRQGLCRVRTFIGSTGEVIALLTDIGDLNIGPSVTNAIEYVYAALVQRGLIPSGTRAIEHYERIDYERPTFDLVAFSYTGTPTWEAIDTDHVAMLLGCSPDELASATLTNERLMAEIDRLRNAINPFANSPWLEAPAIINRREDISAQMIAKSDLSRLVESGAGERDLQRLLKQDPSILGEMYSHPHEEYIVLSEFPLGDGFVDFVIFTGCSRMDVVLVEVKGADFFLVNDDNYGEFSQRINQAVGQIRRRLGAIYRDMRTFRTHVHNVRRVVEAGSSLHNAFVGPHQGLGVDPNKDITLRTVVIGGRTRDDLRESKKRHDFEHGASPPIKIESWDTWIRKLRRQ